MLFLVFFALLSVGLSTKYVVCSDIRKIISHNTTPTPSLQLATHTITPKVICKQLSRGVICQFGTTDIIPGTICTIPAIGASLNLLRYYNKLPYDALLSQANAYEASESVVQYLQSNYDPKKPFPFKKIYISRAEEGPGVFGDGNLLISSMWEKEINAYTITKTITELTALSSELNDTNTTRQQFLVYKNSLETSAKNSLNRMYIEQEKKNRDLKFKVILPHEEAHIINKDYRNLNLLLLGSVIPPAIALACGAPDALFDFTTFSTLSEISIKTCLVSGYLQVYKKAILMPFMRYREKKADEHIKDKDLGIQYFEELAKTNDKKSDTHPKNSDRAKYLKKIIESEKKNDV